MAIFRLLTCCSRGCRRIEVSCSWWVWWLWPFCWTAMGILPNDDLCCWACWPLLAALQILVRSLFNETFAVVKADAVELVVGLRFERMAATATAKASTSLVPSPGTGLLALGRLEQADEEDPWRPGTRLPARAKMASASPRSWLGSAVASPSAIRSSCSVEISPKMLSSDSWKH